jgi:enoyl-CoA hydratase
MAYHEQAGAALQAVFDCRQPTIALVQGACIGGGLEIAAQCDLRICGESARFGAPINQLGFSMYPVEMLSAAASCRVRRRCSKFCSKAVSSEQAEALAKGLVTRVVSRFRGRSRKPTPVPGESARARRWSRAGTNSGCAGCSRTGRLAKQELRASFAFLDSEDYREGLSAFREKRKPQFMGR